MSQVFRAATEKKKKNIWEMSWCHAIVLSDGFLDIATHAAARFPTPQALQYRCLMG